MMQTSEINTRPSTYVPGLEGVIAAQTRLSHVDGLAGELIIAGFALEEIAHRASFEEMVYLLWTGDLPTSGSSPSFAQPSPTIESCPTQ